jgi:hypothetical protein
MGHLSYGIVQGTVCIGLWCRVVSNVTDSLCIDSGIVKLHKVMLLSVCDQIVIMFLFK